MARPSLRETLIESGVDTIHGRGFNASGIRDITGEAGVPLGSFSNHFRSKEAFGSAVLDRYHERTEAIMDATLRDRSRPPLARLHAYFDAIIAMLAAAGWRNGCLVGNMSVEIAEHSELLRAHLERIHLALARPFIDVVRDAQHSGDIRRDLDAEDVGELLLSAWQGAMLRMKVDRSGVPLERFKRVLLATLLKPS